MNDLRHRLLVALASGSVEELAVALGVVQMISTRNNNEPARIFTPSPAQELKCKLYANYLTALSQRN